MNNKKILLPLAAVFFLTSCQSFKNLSAKDYTSASRPLASKVNSDPRFLEDIAVIPENKTQESKYSYNNKSKTKRSSIKIKTPEVVASPLQTKYSIIMDVNAENLSNTALLQQIDDWWGTKYCHGGVNYSCIDCSAFTQMMLRDVYHVRIPRTAVEQYKLTRRVKENELKEGDLVFFNTTSSGISHVGLYLTNDKFVHASSSNGVIISDLNEAYWKKRFSGGGRVAFDAFSSPDFSEDKASTKK